MNFVDRVLRRRVPRADGVAGTSPEEPPDPAAAVPEIWGRVRDAGHAVPIIGDFHYNGHTLLGEHPACAEKLDKYRINPGNVGRGKKRDTQFSTICEIAADRGKPVRIGVNLGRRVFREIHQQLGGQLRFAFSGGAALKPDVALAFIKLGLPLLQGYGLTEAAPCVAAQDWNPRKFFFSNYYEEHVGSVGTPVDGLSLIHISEPTRPY